MKFNSLLPLKTTKGFDYYWKFAYERQNIFFNRIEQKESPWTEDEILLKYKFTNAFRASDRVSQYLIKNVIYNGDKNAEEVFFRIILFKIFNKIETWETLLDSFGEISLRNFSVKAYDSVLSKKKQRGASIYSGAYIMPSGSTFFSNKYKHTNHLELIEYIIKNEIHNRIIDSESLREGFEILRSLPTIGDFLAYQYIIDLNYSDALNFSEMDFVVAGPGAKDGIKKCFSDFGGLNEEEIIKLMTERQDEEFSRLGLSFKNLWGRPLQLIDCQNLFCEVDKYLRVKMPELSGKTGRLRIKQIFKPKESITEYFFPPKWNINNRIGYRKNGLVS